MANKDDYLTIYREFFENFAQTVNPNDQLPVKLGSYKLLNLEVIGGIIDWTTQYLTQKKCPQSLLAPLIHIIIDETRKSCKKQPTACGFNPSDNAYEPLKLMQTVMAQTNEICLRYLDNSMLCSLPPPGPPHYVVTVCAAKNKRRNMEDRHTVIHDLNTIFNIQEASPSSYYAIFDGHAGHAAAAYSAAHLHQFLAESKYFNTNPTQALLDAFCKTDALFIDKCSVEGLSSGTTAVCALLRPKEKILYIAWVGDSQALLVNQGRVLQCVKPHKPSREDEKARIEKEGGYVCFWGTWRVNGQLAVSRAIGDAEYKPYVTAVPEIREITLDGGEDFLIIACDGLWDYLSEDDAAETVYKMVCQCPDKTDLISERLVKLSKERGSADNISVIVVFLREPSKISAEARWANRNGSPITMDTSLDNANNPFANSNGDNIKTDGLLLNLSDNFKTNGGNDLSPNDDFFNRSTPEKANGKRSASEFDDDDDLGPETDVDAVDDVLSPSIIAAKALAEGIVNNNPDGSFNPFVEKCEVEKAALEIDFDLQKQQSSEFDGERSPRDETPTPPADVVHDGGIEDNIADSGEESEDEWNYIKGEEANKENLSPSQPDLEVAGILEDQDSMSQLNPNAAEFVPVSPTRSIPSPACRSLINDPVIAQSPKRASDIDISVPNPQEFENEVKSRPSDFSSYSNGHDHEGDDNGQDLMENLLNGKNIDEIPEFQPGNTPTKVPSTDEFHFGPNAAPFTPAKLLDQSEGSTMAVYGGDTTLDSTVSFKAKDDDPMSTSFYQDQTGGGTNPFDLNKVQMLPDNLDEFLSKADDISNVIIPHDDTISDLPEHDPSTGLNVLDNDERIQTTDLDKVVDEEKEKASPVTPEVDLLGGICELPKSPNPLDDFVKSEQIEGDIAIETGAQSPGLVEVNNIPKSTLDELDDMSKPLEVVEQFCEIPKSPIMEEVCELPKSLIDPFGQLSKSPEPIENDFCQIPKSPELCDLPKSPISQDDEVVIKSPVPLEDDVVIKSPVPLEDDVVIKSPIPLEDDVCELSKSPVPSEDLCQFSKSPAPSEELCQLPKSPEPQILTPEPSGDICAIANKTPEPIESPVEDITSSVKDVSSPLSSPVPDQINFAQEIKNPIQESVPVECLSPIKTEEILIPDTPKSSADIESVATADVNSFLERSQLTDVTSPLSPVADLDQCVYPLPTELKTDTIAPEFAEPAVIITPTAETPVKEPEVAIAAAAVAGVAAAAAATALVVEKKISKPKTAAAKKPAAKPLSSFPLKKTASPKPPATKPAVAKTGVSPKPATTTARPAPKPRTTTTTTSTAKRPLTNGDAKPSPTKTTVKSSLMATRTASTRPATAGAATANKASPTKPATRPTTAPLKTTTTSTKAPAIPKPRPTSLTSKSTVPRTTTTATSAAKSIAAKSTTSPKTASPPKPRPTTVPAKPRVPLSSRVSATKTSADTEKQNKDSANKLTASRTTTKTTTTAGRTVTSTLKKTEAKTTAGTTRTTVTKTSTSSTTKAPIGKKPQEITRNIIKSKTTKIEKPIANGVATAVTEQIIVNNAVNESENLVKDNSPTIDNKLILDINNAAD